AYLLERMGFAPHVRVLEVLLPLGLSFHTFQAMAYTIDVFKRRIPAVDSVLDFALFITLFPQLVAGPVVRARDFFPSLEMNRKIRAIDFRRFLSLFLIGFFKKACISDSVAPFVDSFYLRPSSFGAVGAWTAILLYSVQIYCDFSGYTDMAIACSGLL